MTENSIRLVYAARAIDRSLKQGRNALASTLLSYVARHNVDFGVRKPNVEERKQITSLKRARAEFPYLNEILAGGTLDVSAVDTCRVTTTCGYLATLLATTEIEPLHLAALALTDIHVQNVVLIAAFGVASDIPVNAIPLHGLALISFATGPVTSEHIIREVFGFGSYRDAELIQPRTLFKSSAQDTSVASFEVAAAEPESLEVANAVTFAAKLIEALRGVSNHPYTRIPNATLSAPQLTVTQSLAETMRMADRGNVRGLHFALRSKDPIDASKLVHVGLASEGLKPVRISPANLNDLLAELYAHQVRCLLDDQSCATPPLVIVDDYELLGAMEEIKECENPQGDGTPIIQRAYDATSMSEQKNIFRDKSDIMISPTVWLIDEARPISEELIGTLAEIVTLPTDEIAERASAIVAIGERHGLVIDDNISRRVAASIRNVEDIDGVIKLAALRGTPEDLVRSSRKLLAASKVAQSLPTLAPDRFDLRYVRSTTNIPDLVKKLTPLRDRPISLLFHGAPGTSKTSLARHIAERMGMKIISKKYSEIAGWRVSDNEKGLSRAFAEAVAEDAFLILDEVDSLIRSRDKAQQHWEQSTVNEALTCMDAHPLPFACTTNYLTQLDAAAVRRFRFKIELQEMDIPRARLAWAEILHLPADDFPVGDQMENLTISDFAQVANQMSDLNEHSVEFALSALRAEKSTKQANRNNPIGFLANRRASEA
jgi:hypothetical protein